MVGSYVVTLNVTFQLNIGDDNDDL